MDYDVIILGGGSAGIVAGVTLGGFGLKVLLIEKHRIGGECLHTGCVPSKALIHAASVAHRMRRAGDFGLKSSPLSRGDAAGVLGRVRERIVEVGDADASESLLRKFGVEVRYGGARFLSPDRLEFEGQTLKAEHYLLCTGSHPKVPDLPGLERIRLLTNRNLFDLEEIPETLLVVGGGPLGVEMAQAFQRLGCAVTLVQKNERLLPQDDPDLVEMLTGFLREEGIDLHFQSRLERFEAGEHGTAVAVLIDPSGRESRIPCREVLFATGRAANREGLNLDAAGVESTADGVRVDETLHTTGPRVWACGDVIGPPRFSHMAEAEAKLVAQNLFLPLRQRFPRRIVPRCTFTDPELAGVGWTEAEARAREIPHLALRQSFGQDDRALVEGEGRGTVKLLVSPGWKGTILGAQILGPRAGELLQEFILAMENGLGVRALADSIHVYPTLTMASQHAAQRWYEHLSEDPKVRTVLGAYRSVRPALPKLAVGALAGAAAGTAWWLSKRRKNE